MKKQDSFQHKIIIIIFSRLISYRQILLFGIMWLMMKRQDLFLYKINQAAKNVRGLEFIYTTIAKRMIDRLHYIKLNPVKILDIGSGLAIDAKLLHTKYPDSSIYKLDIALNMLKKLIKRPEILERVFWIFKRSKNQDLICADAIKLPLVANSFDIVWSNLTLPYITHIEAYLREIRRVLKIGGCFFLSGLGVDSLEELRRVGLNTYNFPDMHMIGDILVKLGFSNPVMDMEYITLEYDDFKLLLEDVKVLGLGVMIENKTVLKRQDYHDLETRFKQLTKNGKIPLTLEIFYAHAWKDKIQLDLPENQKVIQFTRRKG